MQEIFHSTIHFSNLDSLIDKWPKSSRPLCHFKHITSSSSSFILCTFLKLYNIQQVYVIGIYLVYQIPCGTSVRVFLFWCSNSIHYKNPPEKSPKVLKLKWKCRHTAHKLIQTQTHIHIERYVVMCRRMRSWRKGLVTTSLIEMNKKKEKSLFGMQEQQFQI